MGKEDNLKRKARPSLTGLLASSVSFSRKVLAVLRRLHLDGRNLDRLVLRAGLNRRTLNVVRGKLTSAGAHVDRRKFALLRLVDLAAGNSKTDGYER